MKKKITKNNNNKNGQEKNRTDQPAAPNIRETQQLRTKRIDVLMNMNWSAAAALLDRVQAHIHKQPCTTQQTTTHTYKQTC